jgi:hypothetical protein
MTARRALLALLVLAAVPASALAAKLHTVAPTRAQRAAIIKAFGDQPAAAPCLIVGLAASNHNWARLRPRLKRTCRRWTFNGVNAIKRTHDNHWKVMFEGSAYGCPVKRIPRAVQRDLGICS